jgi:hypothetical protein
MVVLDRPLRWYVDQGFLEPANSSSTPDDGP